MFGDTARQQLDFLLNSLSLVLIEVDGKGIIHTVRGRGAQHWHFPKTHWVGRPFSVVGKQFPPLAKAMERGLNGRTFQQTLTYEGVSLQTACMSQWDPQGRPNGLWVAIAEQGTLVAPIPADHDHTFLSSFIEHAPAAIAMFDRDMHYLAVSDRWIQDNRLREDPIGRPHYEMVPEIPDRWKRVHRRCLSGVVESCEEDRFERADGTIDYLDWVVAPWYDSQGEIGGLIIYTQLVNERVATKLEQQQLNEKLAQSNQRMADFALAVSHTLQEPLRQALQVDLPLNSQPPRQNEWLNYLRRLEKIVSNLLDLTHQQGQMAYHQVAMDEVMDEVMSNLAPLMTNRPAHVLYGNLPTLYANEFEMVALMQQLITNGITYNEAPVPEVILSVEQTDSAWKFSVRDNGTGIDASSLATLFHFGREIDEAHPRGAGIGLPMCKRIIEHMGGKMWVDSAIQQGSTFHFLIPFSPKT